MSDPFAEAALLMADSRYALGREYSAPLGGHTLGRLELPRGSAQLTLRGGADPSLLFQARFGSPMAEVVEQGGTVHVVYRQYGGPLKREKYDGLILLNSGVPWAIECTGGAVRVTADLRGVTLTSLAVSHGVSHVDIHLDEPSDVVPITVRGGVSHVTIRRPRGSAARLRVKGGASKVTFDQHSFGAVGGKLVLATTDIDLAARRYEIDVVGGVSNLQVITVQDREQPASPSSPRAGESR